MSEITTTLSLTDLVQWIVIIFFAVVNLLFNMYVLDLVKNQNKIQLPKNIYQKKSDPTVLNFKKISNENINTKTFKNL